MTYIPEYSMVRASAGNGYMVEHEFIDNYIAFRKEWMADMKLNPSKVAVIRAEGDSMSPTISSGDLLMIDMRDCDGFSRDAMYVFSMDDGLLIKRIQRIGKGRIEIRSDNPAYRTWIPDPEELESIRVIGRVVWAGRSV